MRFSLKIWEVIFLTLVAMVARSRGV